MQGLSNDQRVEGKKLQTKFENIQQRDAVTTRGSGFFNFFGSGLMELLTDYSLDFPGRRWLPAKDSEKKQQFSIFPCFVDLRICNSLFPKVENQPLCVLSYLIFFLHLFFFLSFFFWFFFRFFHVSGCLVIVLFFFYSFSFSFHFLLFHFLTFFIFPFVFVFFLISFHFLLFHFLLSLFFLRFRPCFFLISFSLFSYGSNGKWPGKR